MESQKPPIVLLMGPTASGKTGLALSLAEHLPAEIVSVDSAQVYRGMDIGTAKPSAEIRARVPHHLIDIEDPREPYSAARFRTDALRAIEGIRARGRMPLLAGGTMLYFRALQRGLSDLPSASPAVRAKISAEANQLGWPAMHRRLQERDPKSAARLHPNDGQRIQRALELIELSGRPASELLTPSGEPALAAPVVKLALAPATRALLHERIAQRFREMVAAGFVDEVARLRARGDLSPDLPSMRAVGYRQLWAHLDGKDSLETAVGKGVAATRQLAKRQLTWLRSEPHLAWLDADAKDVTARALEHVRRAAVQDVAW
jgi:tRNA dimethylallyltransferase